MTVIPSGKPLSEIKVLIIEDDSVTRIALCSVLRRLNCKIIIAEDGCMGVDLFKKERPDIVMTDILMPRKEGLETIAEIRACDPNVKIVAMSGGGMTRNMSLLSMAEKVGATCCVQKPFTPSQIRTLLQSLEKVSVT